ncbi:ATP-binding protein [Nonomuraea sp. NPDC048916]|uniref:ATP-binding protein n=1 Tax=Nonomuraea sp. NPDC048916 TaxID=3154232 RepID=UPI0033F89F1E
MSKHFLGFTEVATLETSQFQLTKRIIADLVKLRGMGVLHGPTGSGKSFAVKSELQDRAATSSPACYITEAHEQPTMRNTLDIIAAALTGHEPPENENRFKLTARLVKILTGPERLIVIDEAQRLNGKCIEVLRHLHDSDLTCFALLLVGGDGCWEVLSRSPMLKSRIVRRLPFQNLSAEAIIKLISGYHPIYEGIEPEILLEINKRYGEGNLRNWATFTLTAAQLCAETNRERIDAAVIANAYTLLGGGKSD